MPCYRGCHCCVDIDSSVSSWAPSFARSASSRSSAASSRRSVALVDTKMPRLLASIVPRYGGFSHDSMYSTYTHALSDFVPCSQFPDPLLSTRDYCPPMFQRSICDINHPSVSAYQVDIGSPGRHDEGALAASRSRARIYATLWMHTDPALKFKFIV